MLADDLAVLLRERKAVVGVIGLGYVGLPLCLAIAEAGMRVLGFDLDFSKPARLERGISYFKHIPDERIRSINETSLFSATSDFSRLAEVDAILICVPTPLTAHRALVWLK
jgi:UDP-N-acetyl-D-glucosamine dehydrogenase